MIETDAARLREDMAAILAPEKAEDRALRGTTLEQRRLLIASYLRSGNMTAAMEEAGIRSPRTAYLWWRRFQAQGAAGLVERSRARKTQAMVPEEIAAEVCEIRRQQPDWGRRRIAQELTRRYGRIVVSPAGVQEVLRRAGLWVAAIPTVADSAPAAATRVRRRDGIPDLDRLIPRVIEGINLSIQCRSREAVDLLGKEIWRPLERDRSVWSDLLNDPDVGDLFLRSRIQLGHSLMSTGQWRLARHVLDETLGWLHLAAGTRQESDWREPPAGVSLRRDDAQIECYQYLGIILRDRDPTLAQSRVRTALADIRSKSRTLVPTNAAIAVGNLERDLAKLILRSGTGANDEVELHLRASTISLQESGDLAMLAATDMAWASLHARRAERARGDDRSAWLRDLDSTEIAIEQALAAIDRLDSPLLQTDFSIDATRLSIAQGIPGDQERLRRAANLCLKHGYGGQAAQVLDLPGVTRLLPQDVISELAKSARPLTDG